MTDNKMLQVSSSPHIHSNASTTRIMLDVIIALLPATAMSAVIFGARTLLLIAVCVSSCVAFEYLWCLILKKPAYISDLSAVVTGMLLAFNLPAGLPLWQAIFGSFVAIVIVKQLFGGIGCNFANPALVGRMVMALSFPSTMTNYTFPINPDWAVFADAAAGATSSATSSATVVADAVAGVTPLAVIGNGLADKLDIVKMLFGFKGGMLGETCVIALVLGGIYLVIRGVIKPVTPLVFIGTVYGMTALFGTAPLQSILSGGLMLGAIFMATDYTTSPYTNWGKAIFGVGCGLITFMIREFGSLAEGVSYAILFMNLVVPYINSLCRKKAFGGNAK